MKTTEKKKRKRKVRACRVCGCTEHNACIGLFGNCYWIEKDLCSACQSRGEEKKKK